MNRLVFLACAVAVSAATQGASASTFGFKGMELGSGIANLANNPKYECRTARAPGADTICSLRVQEKETIAGAPVRSLFFFYFDGRLTGISIHLDERHFASAVEALRAKYGEGRLRSESIRNLKGVAFENQTYTWNAGGDTLTALRYAGRVDQSAIRFSADALIRSIEQHRAAVARDPRKDL